MQRAEIAGADYSEERIGKNAWLSYNIDAVAKVRQRAGDFTGLNMAYAEQLQVLNYGVGGYFDLHLDVSTIS